MKLVDLIEALEKPKMYDPLGKLRTLDVDGIVSDSRQGGPRKLFVAVSGFEVDGHQYIPAAIAKGIEACVVEKKQRLSRDIVQIQVSNSRQALSRLSCKFYKDPSKNLVLIGVTGTNGKTTSTYLLESIFKEAGFIPGVIGTVNYRYLGKEFQAPLTTPDPIQFQAILEDMRSQRVTHVVSEVSSHALALNRVDGTHFDGAIFTNLTLDHLDFHKDFNHYYSAKKRLFMEVLPQSQKKNKLSVINVDDPYGFKLFEELKKKGPGGTILSYGLSRHADVFSEEYQFDLKGIRAKIRTPSGIISFQSPLLGEFNLLNILGTVAMAAALNIPSAVIERGISGVTCVSGRLERVDEGQDFLVLVDYAHTDDALKNVGRALTELKQTRIITVFGCGGDRDRTKRPLMAKAAASFSDIVIVTSDNPRTEEPAKIIEDILMGLKEMPFPLYSDQTKTGYLVEMDRKLAISRAVELAAPSDIVLIAGKGHEDYQILGKTKIHFDDREVSREAICLKQKRSLKRQRQK